MHYTCEIIKKEVIKVDTCHTIASIKCGQSNTETQGQCKQLYKSSEWKCGRGDQGYLFYFFPPCVSQRIDQRPLHFVYPAAGVILSLTLFQL